MTGVQTCALPISEKISKKGSKFGIVSILDFHGTVEFMLFEDKLKELQENFDLNEPIAFKVRISKNGIEEFLFSTNGIIQI